MSGAWNEIGCIWNDRNDFDEGTVFLYTEMVDNSGYYFLDDQFEYYGDYSGNDDVLSQGGSVWEPYAGTAGAIASEMYYSKTYGTWMGKNFKMYQQTWGGNGITGGKIKFGKKVSTGIKVGGYGLGIWNAYKINSQHSSGQISDGQMYMEQGSNLITTVGSIYGAAWGVGWELGRAITNTGWYQEAKFNFWYNRWESQVGAPSQSNEALWYYFYQNYKP